MKKLLLLTLLLCGCGKEPANKTATFFGSGTVEPAITNNVTSPLELLPPRHYVRWFGPSSTTTIWTNECLTLPVTGDFRIQSGIRDDGVMVWRKQ